MDSSNLKISVQDTVRIGITKVPFHIVESPFMKEVEKDIQRILFRWATAQANAPSPYFYFVNSAAS